MDLWSSSRDNQVYLQITLLVLLVLRMSTKLVNFKTILFIRCRMSTFTFSWCFYRGRHRPAFSIFARSSSYISRRSTDCCAECLGYGQRSLHRRSQVHLICGYIFFSIFLLFSLSMLK